LKRIVVLGSTGSVGRQTLEVVSAFPERFEVVALAAGSNVDLLAEQAAAFRPRFAALADESAARAAATDPRFDGVAILAGDEGVRKAAAADDVDVVVAASSGLGGLLPVMDALRLGRTVALANKEVLVAAGELVMDCAVRHGARIIPVDSEHSAVHQCLAGVSPDDVKRIVLTASGGPFYDLDPQRLCDVTPAQALDHPRWRMGRKITVDSATLMNKGLEVIEARWLFDVGYDRIEVVVHRQSVVHSAVELADGSFLAQMAPPDMRLPIAYALSEGRRVESRWKRLDLFGCGPLTFEPPDLERFPCLGLAVEAGRAGGTMPAALCGSDDIAVQMFLDGRIGFTDVPRIVGRVLEKHRVKARPTLDDIIHTVGWARAEAGDFARTL